MGLRPRLPGGVIDLVETLPWCETERVDPHSGDSYTNEGEKNAS